MLLLFVGFGVFLGGGGLMSVEEDSVNSKEFKSFKH